MSRFTLRRGLAIGVSAFAVIAPLGVTASAAAPVAASAVNYGRLFVHPQKGISNWGGYIAISSPGHFTSAQASWTVAKVDCSISGLFAPWVGIDGDGSQTVEQTGVQTECSGGQASYSAWYEMYPQGPVYYPDPVSVGDKFTASVTASGTNFTLTIKDDTKGWSETTKASLSSAQLLSAEAVMEAPGGYPGITKQSFTNVKFNGIALKKNHPVRSRTQSGTATVYRPSHIKHSLNFNMVPVK